MKKSELNKLLKNADVTITCEPEDMQVRGHFASGEPELDKKLEDEIIARADNGDTWAWCCVKVVVTVEHGDTQYRGESNWLGGCSYKNEKDFRRCPYFRDMKSEALEALQYQLEQRPLDPSDIKITKDAQRQALADMVNRRLMYRSPEIEQIRQILFAILKG